MAHDIRDDPCLVTGASSGIGAAIAVELARRGCRVALLARRRDRLAEVADAVEAAGGRPLTVPADVTVDREVEASVETVRERWGRIDILINNAGTGLIARLDETPVEEAAALLDLNVLGMLRVIRAVVPGMVERGEGAVVQMSSGAGLKAVPYNGVYAASKFAVTGMTQALRLELAPAGIRVHCVYPVGTESEFIETTTDHVDNPASRRYFQGPLSPVQSVETVARATVRGIERGTVEIYPYRPLRLLRLADAIAPRLVERLGGLEAYRDRLAGERADDDRS